jgi:hypothetical protein
MEKKQDIYFQKIDSSDTRLTEFVRECSNRDIKNNSSVEVIQFHKYSESAFFAGIHDEKIKVFSGVHKFNIFDKTFWRVGFRGVTLYDEKFKPMFSKNWRRSSLNMGVNFFLQMKWVEQNFGTSEFVITSNDQTKSSPAGRSHDVDRMAKSNKLSGMEILYEDVLYANTVQNIWILDKKLWYEDFEKYYKNIVFSLD